MDNQLRKTMLNKFAASAVVAATASAWGRNDNRNSYGNDRGLKFSSAFHHDGRVNFSKIRDPRSVEKGYRNNGRRFRNEGRGYRNDGESFRN